MEIELKYRLENEDIAKQVEEVTLNSDYTVESSDQQLDMKAVYFDTEDGLLQKNLIAFRIRKEGTRNIATLKWGGKQEGSLHVREELNISVEQSLVCKHCESEVERYEPVAALPRVVFREREAYGADS